MGINALQSCYCSTVIVTATRRRGIETWSLERGGGTKQGGFAWENVGETIECAALNGRCQWMKDLALQFDVQTDTIAKLSPSAINILRETTV